MGREETEHLDDFASAFEAAFGRLQVRLEEVCGGAESWAAGVAVGVRAALEFAAADPEAANTLTNEALGAGLDGVARRERLLAYAGEALAPGRQLRDRGDQLPQMTEHAIAGGIASLIADRVARGRAAELPGLAREAIQFALTPYLGTDEAIRVASLASRPGPETDR